MSKRYGITSRILSRVWVEQTATGDIEIIQTRTQQGFRVFWIVLRIASRHSFRFHSKTRFDNESDAMAYAETLKESLK
jgi:hypothetical protein